MAALVWLGVVGALFGGSLLAQYGIARQVRPTASGRLRPAVLGLAGLGLLGPWTRRWARMPRVLLLWRRLWGRTGTL